MAEQIGNRNLKEQESRDAMIAAAIIVPVVTLAAVGYVVARLMGLRSSCQELCKSLQAIWVRRQSSPVMVGQVGADRRQSGIRRGAG
jgi:hypothetical protein